MAALVWRPGPGEVDVLLVTSRETGRWLVPKGWMVDGKTAIASALQEAYEEAGALAEPSERLLGSYGYDKILKDGSVMPCAVGVFAVPLLRVLDRWPEMNQRKRRWYSAGTAASLVREPGLADLLRQFEG